MGVISKRMANLDMQTHSLIQPYTAFLIQRTLQPSGHMGRRCEHELRKQGRSQSAWQALPTQGPLNTGRRCMYTMLQNFTIMPLGDVMGGKEALLTQNRSICTFGTC